ncbi:MAG TPA: 6-pyruvoyl-tetrahydropterin synthase-related protein [Candidatus Sulfotelmatobacter sp.]|nr:6-pyruvoyl-tetrahydropterin synthase-related protein [Candidatus Sulfotelmatobacter sp.]
MFAVEIPFFFFGTPSGHDVEFHLYSWLDVLSQWKHGILYPRWAGLAHFGFGEPRFIFYPPASWTLGATLSALLPWTLAASVYIWVVLVAAGASMFVLARRWLERRDAIFAAVLYAVNPYHLVIVYWRSAFAEMLAACLVPLLVLCVLRAAEDNEPMLVPLGLVLAGSWLTNAPAAVMIHYSLALLLVFFAVRERSPRLLLAGAGAVAVGACLAGFYLLPAVYEQRWVNIAQAVSAGSRPTDNFLFIHTTDPDHDAFNRIISWIAVLEMSLCATGALAAWLGRRMSAALGSALGLWGVLCGLLLFSPSRILWTILPKLRFMQFPWRWLLCLSVIFTLFVTLGLRRWWMRAAVCAVSVLVIVAAWTRVQAPWWDNAADLREMQDNMDSGVGYEGTDEYTPTGADAAAVDKEARHVKVRGQARAAIHVLRWDAAGKEFTAHMSAPDRLSLKLFPYPAWRVEVNGHRVDTSAAEGTGQMLVPVQAGMNQVQIRFVRTWDRSLGGWISLAAGILIVVWYLWPALGRRAAA